MKALSIVLALNLIAAASAAAQSTPPAGSITNPNPPPPVAPTPAPSPIPPNPHGHPPHITPVPERPSHLPNNPPHHGPSHHDVQNENLTSLHFTTGYLRNHMRTDFIAALCSILVATLSGSCAAVDQFGSRVRDGNLNSQDALNQETLLNIIRARDLQPLNFFAITQVSGGQTETLNTGMPTVTFGPAACGGATSIPYYQFALERRYRRLSGEPARFNDLSVGYAVPH